MRLAKEGKKSFDVAANYIDLLRGCICSVGKENTQADTCGCQCDGTTTNFNFNYNVAYKA